jgi:hypothetical protein
MIAQRCQAWPGGRASDVTAAIRRSQRWKAAPARRGVKRPLIDGAQVRCRWPGQCSSRATRGDAALAGTRVLRPAGEPVGNARTLVAPCVIAGQAPSVARPRLCPAIPGIVKARETEKHHRPRGGFGVIAISHHLTGTVDPVGEAIRGSRQWRQRRRGECDCGDGDRVRPSATRPAFARRFPRRPRRA